MQSVPESSPSDAVVVGRVLGAYGVQGWLRIEPFNAPEDSVLLHARRWHLQAAEGGRPSTNRPQLPLPTVLTVERCRVQGANLVAGVAEIGVREVAESLRGCVLVVSRADFPAAEPDEFYWVDLIGCSVVTPEGAELGTVEAVDDHGAHPLLLVRAQDGREHLIPFVTAHVPEVDLAGRRIVADWDPDF